MDADFLREFAKNCIAAEREACAQLVENYLGATTESKRFGIEAAKAIRARTLIAEERETK